MADLKVGDVFRTQTKTREDVFGDCVWRVTEIGLAAPERGREEEMDGVGCELLGGSGPSARAGYTVVDSQFNINTDISRGVTSILPPDQARPLVENFEKTKAQGGVETPRNPALGVEMP